MRYKWNLFFTAFNHQNSTSVTFPSELSAQWTDIAKSLQLDFINSATFNIKNSDNTLPQGHVICTRMKDVQSALDAGEILFYNIFAVDWIF